MGRQAIAMVVAEGWEAVGEVVGRSLGVDASPSWVRSEIFFESEKRCSFLEKAVKG